MNRRQLLAGALAGTALLASPNLAFAGYSAPRRRAMLGEAWKRAADRQRPLLVLLLPGKRQYARGNRMGIWLNNGSDEDLAPLARVEMACATLHELDRLVPGVKAADGAWMVLVRVDQDTPTWRSIVVPDVPDEARLPDYEDFVAAWTREHGDSDWDTVHRAWRQEQKAASKVRLRAELEAFRASVGRVLASEGLTGGRTTRLADEARARWVKQAPPGAHWATSYGCGTSVEPNPGEEYEDVNEHLGILCGMGHVERYAARFLHFWDVG